MGCLRNTEGTRENVIAQIVDITAEVAARDRLAEREKQLSAEIASAARYVESLLPHTLTGRVNISSRYLPSLELGGDCFHYRWLDDDTLSVYLIDVSGHGVRPALLSVSVHNMIRSGSLPASMLMQPDQVLGTLNALFQAEQHDDSYFTMWYGIFECSSRTLRYASAGSPPALAFHHAEDGSWQVTALRSNSVPVGLFAETRFDTMTCQVPQGARVLLFSDGAFDMPLADGRIGSLRDLTNLVLRQLESGHFSADSIVEQLREATINGEFEDDCSVVTIDFSADCGDPSRWTNPGSAS